MSFIRVVSIIKPQATHSKLVHTEPQYHMTPPSVGRSPTAVALQVGRGKGRWSYVNDLVPYQVVQMQLSLFSFPGFIVIPKPSQLS